MASWRDRTSSLRYRFFRCERTVSVESTSVCAISSVRAPEASRSSTSHSRSVSGLRTGRRPAPARGERRSASTSSIASRREIAASPNATPRRTRGSTPGSKSFDR